MAIYSRSVVRATVPGRTKFAIFHLPIVIDRPGNVRSFCVLLGFIEPLLANWEVGRTFCPPLYSARVNIQVFTTDWGVGVSPAKTL